MFAASRDGHDPAVVFWEEDIIALQELDANERFAPLTRLCANLGLDVDTEIGAIQAHTVVSSGLRLLGRDGYGLRVDLVPLWLLTLDSTLVDPHIRPRLEQYQRECASVLWQSFKPQGFGPEDALLPPRETMTAADQAYAIQVAQANLARQQVIIERHLENARGNGNLRAAPQTAARSGNAFDMARVVRRIAHDLSMRTRRNEYGGIFMGLSRQFGISSYRFMPPGRFREAMEWLERWHGDILGEPEPPPDI